jgi:tRNA (cytidine/uridine-2'-O-)-methyltransferase
LVLLTSHATTNHNDFAFAATDTLLLGRESAGVPDDVHQRADARIRIPMRAGLRSLNIAVAAALVLGEALRQTGGFPAEGTAR